MAIYTAGARCPFPFPPFLPLPTRFLPASYPILLAHFHIPDTSLSPPKDQNLITLPRRKSCISSKFPEIPQNPPKKHPKPVDIVLKMPHALTYIARRPPTGVVQHLVLVPGLLRVVRPIPVSVCPAQCLRSITSKYQCNGSPVDSFQMRCHVSENEGRQKRNEQKQRVTSAPKTKQNNKDVSIRKLRNPVLLHAINTKFASNKQVTLEQTDVIYLPESK